MSLHNGVLRKHKTLNCFVILRAPTYFKICVGMGVCGHAHSMRIDAHRFTKYCLGASWLYVFCILESVFWLYLCERAGSGERLAADE